MYNDVDKQPSLDMNKSKRDGIAFAWSDLYVTCRQKSSCTNWLRRTKPQSGRVLLDDVSGIARSGEILAIMGSSGVGKTTLLKVLSGQDDSRTTLTTGDISLNNCLTTRSQRSNGSIIGYVEQRELFVETMTSEEHLIFQAMLSMEQSISDEDRRIRVDQIIILFSLEQTAKTVINQLSGGERKRLTLATVLLTDPPVILIDEPTSGLDTYLAMRLMKVIRKLAVEQHRCVIVVLHQPTSEMFALVDSLCLLVHGGRQAYFGDKDEATRFFADECGLQASSLDHYIEQLAETPDAGKETVHRGNMVANQFIKSTIGERLEEDISRLSEQGSDKLKIEEMDEWRSGFSRQLKWLLWRSYMSGARDPIRTVNVLIRTLIPSIFLGLLYFNIPRSAQLIQNLDAASMAILNVTMNACVFVTLCTMPTDIHIYIKETNRRIYASLPFYISLVLRDLPLFIVMSFLFTTIVYWFSTVDNGFVHYVLYVSIVIVGANAAAALGALGSSLSTTVESAIAMIVPINLLFFAFSGFIVDLRYIPGPFRLFEYLSHFQYAFSALHQLQMVSNTSNQISQCRSSTNSNKGTLGKSVFLYDVFHDQDVNEYYSTLRRYMGFDVSMLLILYVVYHTFAFFIVWYRGHRNRLAERRSIRKQKKKDRF